MNIQTDMFEVIAEVEGRKICANCAYRNDCDYFRNDRLDWVCGVWKRAGRKEE